MSFVSDLRMHVSTFAQQQSVDEAQVHVKLTLADGDEYVAQGLTINDATSQGGCAMIRGHATDASPVLCIRDTHIVKAELDTSPQEKPPIGFHAE